MARKQPPIVDSPPEQYLETNDYQNTLFHATATDLLKALPTGSIDCVVTSVPYWGARDYDSPDQIGMETDRDQYLDQLLSIFTELKPTLHPDGCLFLSIDDLFQSTAPGTQNTASNLNDKTSNSQAGQFRFDGGVPPKSLMGLPEQLLRLLQDKGWLIRNKIIWKKPNPIPEPQASDRYRSSWEPIYLLTKQQQYSFNEHAASENDVWTIPTASVDTAHPAPFPIEIPKRAIKAACPPNGIVLDPFIGSGQTAIAAKSTGRKYIGCDINHDYLNEAATRINSATKGNSTDWEKQSHKQTALPNFD